jgi:hypothetical protein
MERLKQMDKEQFVREMQAEVRAALERVADAVNGAAEGRVINGSEIAVREAKVDLQRKSFEKALQMRIDSTESTFSPAAGRGGKSHAASAGAGVPAYAEPQRVAGTAAGPVAGGRRRGGGSRGGRRGKRG